MGKYKRKTTRQSWDENRMRDAIEAVRTNRLGWLAASKRYQVPFSTLRRRARKNDPSKGYLGGHKQTFNTQLEEEIVAHLQNLEIRFFGMTAIDVRKLAYDIAVKKKIHHRFSHETKMAGLDWLRAFRRRNPGISLRIPEATSAARARAFNRPQVEKFFRELGNTMDKYKFEPQQIWNVDESGFSTVPTQNQKIFATKGRKQVGILTSGERGHHYTAVCCVNALGMFIPPVFIFPRKNMKESLMDNAPAGSVGFAQDKGWMNGEVFLKWLKHFVKFAKPSPENMQLLLLDGHSSHKSIEVLTFAKENNIVLFCFPPHCTHRMQPLDISFFGPLNTFYNQELSRWLRNNPGKTVSHQQVAGIFKEAYSRAATVKNAQCGFSSAGIYPLNENIFPEWMFAPATVTENALPAPETQPDVPDLPPTDPAIEPAVRGENAEDELPGTSASTDLKVNDSEDIPDNPVEANVSPSKEKDSSCLSIADISPLPVAVAINRPIRKKGKFGFLNSTPEIEEIKTNIATKKAEVLRRSGRKAKRRVEVPSSDSEELFPDIEDDDETFCIYCMEPFSHSKSKEWWLQCQICKKWAHAECLGVNRRVKNVICDLCS